MTGLSLLALLAVAEGIRAAVPLLRTYGLPASILAGVLGLALGPGVLGLLPADPDVLRTGVYHALGVVFIALTLQAPAPGKSASGRSMAFGITALIALQTALGLAVVLGLGMGTGAPLHPGLGLMLPLGFEQGPGQALAMGEAWTRTGLDQGADVGLIVAAIGYAWSVVVGIPLVIWGRRRGLISPTEGVQVADAEPHQVEVVSPGGLERLAQQVVTIGVIYLATYGVCRAAAFGFERGGLDDIGHMVWGFHFIIGALLAMAARPVLTRFPGGSPLDDALLGKLAGLTVDVSTCAALAAVQLSVLAANWLPILAVTTVGGLATLVFCVVVAVRGFRDAPFEHCVIWFGTGTGTLPMGLALLRIIDPELKSSAPSSMVWGSAGAIVGVAPILLFIHPIPILGWVEEQPLLLWGGLGISTLYLGFTMVAWSWWGGLRLRSGGWAEWSSDS
jgi:ESS family glutamate:Na+ symporter